MDFDDISSLTDEQLTSLREEIVESLDDDDVRVNEAVGQKQYWRTNGSSIENLQFDLVEVHL